ncbi:MAG TPA: hypothetical protein VGD78_06335 [Chthoniobacterales bacterium]
MTLDWETFARETAGSAGDEFDLATVLPGDTLHVVTTHTRYEFEIIAVQDAFLRCSRVDRPDGLVRIAGCGYPFSCTFKPKRLFCGGHLEFTFVEGTQRTRFRTTCIQGIFHRHHQDTP